MTNKASRKTLGQDIGPSDIHERSSLATSLSSEPLVSVLIPTFNRVNLLGKAIESVIQQTYQNIEIIVIDDASDEDIAAACASQAHPVTHVRHDRNKGRAAALNTGLAACHGSFIAVLDSDDYWLPHKIERQLRVFEEFPEAGAVCGGAKLMDLSGQPYGPPKLPPYVVPYEKLVLSMSYMPGSNSNELVKREVFEQIGGYDEGLRRAQDYEFWLRVARMYPIRGVRDVLMFKRAHASARPDADVETISNCRLAIASRIPERWLRRKHKALMWFRLHTLYASAGQPALAAKSVVLSFLNYPMGIERQHRRLRPLLGKLKDQIFERRPKNSR